MTRYEFSDGQFSIKGRNISIPKIKLLSVIDDTGANGVVLKGHHLILNRDVAVKIWLPRRGFEYPDPDRFFAEIQKISNLNRPRIVKIDDADVLENGFCYAILELINGITLREWLSEERTIDDRLSIAKKIFDEVKFVHNQRIYHGDLHDRNILILENGEIKLIDFGTSIFSYTDVSHERESRIILQTALEIFPEEDQYQFIDKNALQNAPPECVSYTIDAYIRILGFFREFELKENPNFGPNGVSMFCGIWASTVPFFNYRRFLTIFEDLGFEEGYFFKFLSTLNFGCRKGISNQKKWPEMGYEISEDIISNLPDLYLEWQKEFIKRVRGGSLDFSLLDPTKN